MTTRIAAIPHLGHYYIGAKPVAELFGDKIIIPPAITRRTLEIGSKYSPESACIPFKYTLGNYIEALERGANVLIQGGGGCRMGFYGEVQKVILQKMGYEFDFIKFVNSHNLLHIGMHIKRLQPRISYWQIARTLYLAYHKMKAIDIIEDYVRHNLGFEVEAGSFERLFKQYLDAVDHAATVKAVQQVTAEYEPLFRALPLNKPEKPLRVGLVGEFYVVMEPFSNFFVEKELARYGIEVFRHVRASEFIVHSFRSNHHFQELLHDAAPYLTAHVGAHGTESVAVAHRLAKEGYDGIIHVKPFACIPEVNAMPALHRLSQDYRIPVIFFSFDTLTSETGIKTRLEAFYDMLVMKRGEQIQL